MGNNKFNLYYLCVILNAITSIYFGYIYGCSNSVYFGFGIFVIYLTILNTLCALLCVFKSTSLLALALSLTVFFATFSISDKNMIEKYENVHAKNICQFLQDWDVAHSIADSHLIYHNSQKDFTQGNCYDNVQYVKNEIKQYYYSLEKVDSEEDVDRKFEKDWLEFVKWFDKHHYPQDGVPFRPKWKPQS